MIIIIVFIPAFWSSSMDAIGFDKSQRRSFWTLPDSGVKQWHQAASLSCTCRHGYRVNQLFIWEMFGWPPITPVDMWRKGVIPSCQKCCEASNFCCFAGSFWEPPWKTEAVAVSGTSEPRFSHSKWLNLFGRHWLERQLWFGFPFCEFASQQFQKQKPCSAFFHETWVKWRLHFKTCKIAVSYVLPSIEFSVQFCYIAMTFLPVPTSFIS